MIIAPVVGQHFRPPAKALCSALSAGTPLILEREPDNPHDPQAVRVLVRTADLPLGDDLEEALLPMGFDLDAIREADEWHLGYLPRKEKASGITWAQVVSEKMDSLGLTRIEGKVAYTLEGNFGVALPQKGAQE